MAQFFNWLRFGGTGNFALDFALALIISAVMAWLVSILYKRTHRGLNYEHSYISSLVLIAPIVTTVMFYIQGDLVLSLGLVGSLSIIRFRTPIKDTRDMIFLFWSIAIGLGAGTYNWLLVGIATLFIAICVTLLYLLGYDRVRHSDYVLVLTGAEPLDLGEVREIVKRYARTYRVRSREYQDDSWELVLELSFLSPVDSKIEAMLSGIRRLQGIGRVSLLAPQLALPM